MDKLWAPWRITYIKNSAKEKRCLFCRVKKTKQKKADQKNLVVLRSAHCFVIINLFPYNNGHLMISPYRHIKDTGYLNDAEALDILKTLNFTKTVLDKILKPHGYNIGINTGKAAGAGIDKHLHIHIVPRWNGDNNFMPAIFKTKVISQSLSELYRLLKKEIKKSKARMLNYNNKNAKHF